MGGGGVSIPKRQVSVRIYQHCMTLTLDAAADARCVHTLTPGDLFSVTYIGRNQKGNENWFYLFQVVKKKICNQQYSERLKWRHASCVHPIGCSDFRVVGWSSGVNSGSSAHVQGQVRTQVRGRIFHSLNLRKYISVGHTSVILKFMTRNILSLQRTHRWSFSILLFSSQSVYFSI